MKLIGRILLLAFLILLISPILVLGYFGFVPGLSSFFGSDKPRDLKIVYTDADMKSALVKNKVEYETLPVNTPDEESIKREGTQNINAEFTSSEMTALMNKVAWKNWPYQNVQVKFNGDGTGEISTRLLKNKLPGYFAYMGVPRQVLDFAIKFLPLDPVIYLKGKVALTNNKMTTFDVQQFEIGRVQLPIKMFLSFVPPKLVPDAYALDIFGMGQELMKVKNKKDLIVYYINGRLDSYYSFFYAKSVYFKENGLVFDGRLPQKELKAK